TTLITEISFIAASPRDAIIGVNTKWTENGVTVAGGNGKGSGLNQLNIPFGLYVDYDQTVYIADYCNHRIVAWKCGAESGEVLAGGNGPGNKSDQLYQPKNVILDKDEDWLIISDYKNRRVVRWPRRGGTSGETIISDVDCTCLTMDANGFLYVCDYKKNEVRRWQVGQTHGIVVAGGNGEGNRLDQFRSPTYVFVDQDHSVYVSDSDNHRVMKWMEGAKEGIIVAGHGGAGSALTQLSYPTGIVVDQLGTIYVADCNNHRIMRWLKRATRGSVLFGGNGAGEQANQVRCPDGLSFDRHGNIYVSTFGNDRVLKFTIDSSERPKQNQLVTPSFAQKMTTLSPDAFSTVETSTPVSQVNQKKRKARRKKKKSHAEKNIDNKNVPESLEKLTANNVQGIERTHINTSTIPIDYSKWNNIDVSSDEETRTSEYPQISELSSVTANTSKLKDDDASDSLHLIIGTEFLCDKDRQEYGSFFRRKEIPSSHAVFQYGAISPVSELIGIPLLIYRYKRYLGYGADDDFVTNNQRITYLMIDSRSGFVQPLGEWDLCIGTALVARRDKQPFNELHAEVIFEYFKFLLSKYDIPPSSEVYNLMNRNGFEKFLGKWNASSKISLAPSDFYFEKSMRPLKNSNSTTADGPLKQLEISTIFNSNIHHNTVWIENGFTVAGGNGSGERLNQLNYPYGVYVDDSQTIYVGDSDNHRIVEWKSGANNGHVVAGGNRKGNKRNQLNLPINVSVDKEKNNLIICDWSNSRIVKWSRQNSATGQSIISNMGFFGLFTDDNNYLYASIQERHEVRRWKMDGTCGTLVAGGNREGNRLNQLAYPTYIFVDKDHSVYVSDWDNHRVMKWMKGAAEGIIVAGGQGQGNGLKQLSCPQGVVVDHLGTVYVADSNNHRVMRWYKGATEGNIVVGGNGNGQQTNQFRYPFGLSFDRQGNLYVVDKDNHRVQRFNIDEN
ncbi:unnamed protein product, partial [Rotaria socialis]